MGADIFKQALEQMREEAQAAYRKKTQEEQERELEIYNEHAYLDDEERARDHEWRESDPYFLNGVSAKNG